MKKIFADANQSQIKFIDGGKIEYICLFNWRMSDSEVKSFHKWYFSHHPTRASRNAGGGKQSRPALRKARNVGS